MPHGRVVFVLHAHLPYVLSHGKWPHGSDWLCEAACETYIPLLNVLDRLSGEGRQVNFTIGITPVLCEMLASPLFKKEGKLVHYQTPVKAPFKLSVSDLTTAGSNGLGLIRI